MADPERLIEPLSFEGVLEGVGELAAQGRTPLFFDGQRRVNGVMQPMVFCVVPPRSAEGELLGTEDLLYLTPEQARRIKEEIDSLLTQVE